MHLMQESDINQENNDEKLSKSFENAIISDKVTYPLSDCKIQNED